MMKKTWCIEGLMCMKTLTKQQWWRSGHWISGWNTGDCFTFGQLKSNVMLRNRTFHRRHQNLQINVNNTNKKHNRTKTNRKKKNMTGSFFSFCCQANLLFVCCGRTRELTLTSDMIHKCFKGINNCEFNWKAEKCFLSSHIGLAKCWLNRSLKGHWSEE